MEAQPCSRASLALSSAAALALAIAGCMGTDVYEGFGKTKPEPPPRPRAAAKPESPPAAPRTARPAGPQNVTVVLEKYDAATVSAAGANLGLRATGGRTSVAVHRGAALARNGIQLTIGSSRLYTRLRASATRGRTRSHQQMFITVADGHEGTLVVGSDAWVNRLGFWTPGGFVVLLERQFVGRSLVVRPKVLGGGRIAIELWPRFSTRRGRVIDVTQLATRVVVQEGQPLLIGGLATEGESVGAVLFGRSGRQSTGSMTLVLTARVGSAGIEWPRGR